MTVTNFATAARHLALAAAAMGVLATSAHADGDYWGVDISRNTTGGVLSATRGDFTFGWPAP